MLHSAIHYFKTEEQNQLSRFRSKLISVFTEPRQTSLAVRRVSHWASLYVVWFYFNAVNGYIILYYHGTLICRLTQICCAIITIKLIFNRTFCAQFNFVLIPFFYELDTFYLLKSFECTPGLFTQCVSQIVFQLLACVY